MISIGALYRRTASALIAAVRGRPRRAFDTPVQDRSSPLPSREPAPEPRPVPPTHRHRLLQAAEVHVLARLRPGLQPLDVLEVHDGRAVDAHELPFGEALLPFAERLGGRLARELRGQEQPGAVAVRRDGRDVAHPDEGTLLAESEQEA